ncbi:superoxide dismutase, Ni [Candidatus Daviesbacteria bacterium RIFCSPLOWO2_01_FULL_39_12]|uniref:Superoxide dismutase, Ni n=1 Tax=Candidatus Daviesbacteria bacterium RIFCSPLOWO2_01_FULL_39_12 TaxID=1797785 RepID=A0A1F5KTH0_9BACT|nr:MAG: superoxide dismutase, Ni [Candidatus Daviesbacteria bacterium RIFCSPLOWO2_01_FULL_39_12]
MRLINFLIKLLPTKPVFAHCDIPCGIYDPKSAQLAAQTVLKMVNLINELEPSSDEPPFDERKRIISQISRLTRVKEDHAELCKKEILILWTDYFKAEHLQTFPELHDLVWKTTKLCSDNKRAVDEDKAQELEKAVDKIADIFAQTKK